MTNQIQFSTFNFHSNAVRVIVDLNQEFWFCGTDVCSILGYTNSRKALQDHCKQAGVTKRYISHPSGKKEAIFINEPNLYRLIIKSRKPEAEPFEAWVFEEVLPQIRKTGQYSQKSTEIAPLTITPEQQQQIQNAVQATHHRTGLSYAEIYQRLKAKFHVAKYDQLRQDQHQEALSFIAGLSATMARTELPSLPSPVRLNEILPLAIFYRDVCKMIAELKSISEALSQSRKSELVAILKTFCCNFDENAALNRKVRGVLLSQLTQLPIDDQEYLRDFIAL